MTSFFHTHLFLSGLAQVRVESSRIAGDVSLVITAKDAGSITVALDRDGAGGLADELESAIYWLRKYAAKPEGSPA